jgi:hypothetical protein
MDLMDLMMIFYKIRNKNNPEMFRKSDGTWNKSGKLYDTLGKLRTAITLTMNSYSSYHRSQVLNWEIVEYQVTTSQVKQLEEIVDPAKVWEMLKKD